MSSVELDVPRVRGAPGDDGNEIHNDLATGAIALHAVQLHRLGDPVADDVRVPSQRPEGIVPDDQVTRTPAFDGDLLFVRGRHRRRLEGLAQVPEARHFIEHFVVQPLYLAPTSGRAPTSRGASPTGG